MEWINYHHLFYFWTVVRAGGIGRASEQLRLAPPTISAQLRSLEGSLGEKLLTRSARGVQPTEVGQIVYRYAEDIFALGREMLDTVKGRTNRTSLTGHHRNRRCIAERDLARTHRARTSVRTASADNVP